MENKDIAPNEWIPMRNSFSTGHHDPPLFARHCARSQEFGKEDLIQEAGQGQGHSRDSVRIRPGLEPRVSASDVGSWAP